MRADTRGYPLSTIRGSSSPSLKSALQQRVGKATLVNRKKSPRPRPVEKSVTSIGGSERGSGEEPRFPGIPCFLIDALSIQVQRQRLRLAPPTRAIRSFLSGPIASGRFAQGYDRKTDIPGGRFSRTITTVERQAGEQMLPILLTFLCPNHGIMNNGYRKEVGSAVRWIAGCCGWAFEATSFSDPPYSRTYFFQLLDIDRRGNSAL